MLLVVCALFFPLLLGSEKYADRKLYASETKNEVRSPLAAEARHYLHGAVGLWVGAIYLGACSFMFTYVPELEKWDVWMYRIAIVLLMFTPLVLARGLYLARLVWK